MEEDVRRLAHTMLRRTNSKIMDVSFDTSFYTSLKFNSSQLGEKCSIQTECIKEFFSKIFML